MKKNIIKSILIVSLVFMFLTFIIPTGIFSGGSFIEGDVVPIGIMDAIRYSTTGLLSNLGAVFISILLIGGMYGMLRTNDRYNNLVGSIAERFSEKGVEAVAFITILYILVASLTGLSIPLLVFVPFTSAVVMKLGYSKVAGFATSIGSILVGNLASTIGFSINGRILEYTSLGIGETLFFRIIFLAAILMGYLYFVMQFKRDEVEEIPLFKTKKKVNKKSFTSIIVLFSVLFVIIILGFYNIDSMFGIKVFENLFNTINNIQVGNIHLINDIFGFRSPLGYGEAYDLVSLLVIVNIVIFVAYKLKLSDFVKGVKEILPTALIILLTGIVFSLAIGKGSYPMFGTIFNWLYTLSNNIASVSVDIPILSHVVSFVMTFLGKTLLFITYFIGGIFNNFYYLTWVCSGQLVSESTNLALDTYLLQTAYGMSTMLLPTSALLVGGLTYFNLDYKEYIKALFKFFMVCLIAIAIIGILIGLVV